MRYLDASTDEISLMDSNWQKHIDSNWENKSADDVLKDIENAARIAYGNQKKRMPTMTIDNVTMDEKADMFDNYPGVIKDGGISKFHECPVCGLQAIEPPVDLAVRQKILDCYKSHFCQDCGKRHNVRIIGSCYECRIKKRNEDYNGFPVVAWDEEHPIMSLDTGKYFYSCDDMLEEIGEFELTGDDIRSMLLVHTKPIKKPEFDLHALWEQHIEGVDDQYNDQYELRIDDTMVNFANQVVNNLIEMSFSDVVEPIDVAVDISGFIEDAENLAKDL